MVEAHAFEEFLGKFIPMISEKNLALNQALWTLETTGKKEASLLKAKLETELRLLLSDPSIYEQLLVWDKDQTLSDPQLKRQLNILIRSFKQNMIPIPLLKEIVNKESELLHAYANFRPRISGKTLTENAIREILKNENDPNIRKQAWEASKEIGEVLAPLIKKVVALRNQAAHALGYTDYFTMQLDLQEVDEAWLFETLVQLGRDSEKAYNAALNEIEDHQMKTFAVPKDQLGPWAWSEPFCQEDPLATSELDPLVNGLDLEEYAIKFYQKMGYDVREVLKNSDMYEREGKNQHAFCINMDRQKDVRTLNNVKPTIKWLETVLHELGHAIYELGFDEKLPWILKEPPHMITTEAMALIAGRQAYLPNVLSHLVTDNNEEEIFAKARQSLKRRQLVFSRWVLVMTHFERELYRQPNNDLNQIWWGLVERYQKIKAPDHRFEKSDWAAKYHIGLAPVYYYSYLLGELFASSLENKLLQETGHKDIFSAKAGEFLTSKLFLPGNCYSWADLIESVLGEKLTSKSWIDQFAIEVL